ncbi:TPA: hemerythrin [Candidatus Dependentiae bacterium]|nr:MAG: hypothetical protein UW09_C0004G0109 [candidate division TM6 bacterium GW2011_GWF2_43_87]HBL98232.1 hemerythrin [Candidatus Dependentiae bacterium]
MQKSFFCTPYRIILSLAFLANFTGLNAVNKKEDLDIPPTEDLMREHGVIHRIFLIYEEIIKRIDKKDKIPLKELYKTANIIRSFIEEYHEKLEENYIFSLFEKNKKETELVKTLKRQHIQGKKITKQLLKIVAQKEPLNNQTKKQLQALMQEFITMYRPHAAWEDTVLFPQVRALITKKGFEDLGEIFEDIETQLFGNKGFETIVKDVESIEKELGIYGLK